MFRVAVLDIEKATLILQETAHSVVLPGEEGEFAILDFHQPIISTLKEGTIKIDQGKSIAIKRGIARAEENELFVLVER